MIQSTMSSTPTKVQESFYTHDDMKYFVTNQHRQLSIQDWEIDMTGNPAFEPLNAEQLAYHEMYPEATPWEVKNLAPRPTPPEPPTPPSLDEIKAEAIKEISAYSLKTIDKFVTTYQYANADSSLKVPDGEGIYSHAKASEVMAKYNRIGKLCREEYYMVKGQIEGATSAEEVEQCQQEAHDYYDSITEDTLV